MECVRSLNKGENERKVESGVSLKEQALLRL